MEKKATTITQPTIPDISTLHYCSQVTPSKAHGAAISECFEQEDGQYWVTNGEYASQVCYCPYCGKKAPVQPSED